jgi:hypothetical protein
MDSAVTAFMQKQSGGSLENLVLSRADRAAGHMLG